MLTKSFRTNTGVATAVALLFGLLASDALAQRASRGAAAPRPRPISKPELDLSGYSKFQDYHILLNLSIPFGVGGNGWEDRVVLRGKGMGKIDGLSLIPETQYRMAWANPQLGTIYSSEFTSGPAGVATEIPMPQELEGDPIIEETGLDEITLYLESIDSSGDSDGDGIPNDIEFVVGTNENAEDSDGDGIPDLEEIIQRSDPLSGLAASPGFVGSGPLEGPIADICLIGNSAYVLGGDGVTVYDVSKPREPVRMGGISLPGDLLSLACAPPFVAVARGASGISVIDTTDTNDAAISAEVQFSQPAKWIVSNGGIAYVGLEGSILVALDMATGYAVGEVDTESPIVNLAFGDGLLFVLCADDYLRLFKPDQLTLSLIGTVDLDVPEIGFPRSVFAGNGYALVATNTGVLPVDTSDPANPLVGTPFATNSNFSQIVANGSGRALALTSTPGLSPQIDLFQLAANGSTGSLVTSFPASGADGAIGISNGSAAYAAPSGPFYTLSYLTYDGAGQAPAITLQSDIASASIEEGALLHSWATVSDDVQVSSVEFFVDGTLVFTDSSYPFEFAAPAPRRSAGKTDFSISAKAFDTGRNSTDSNTLTYSLDPDITPPLVLGTLPEDDAIHVQRTTFAIVFTEIIDSQTLVGEGVTLSRIGGLLGSTRVGGLTGEPVELLFNGFTAASRLASFATPDFLEPGWYELRIGQSVSDLAGNSLGGLVFSRFWITGGEDRDFDDLPDDMELLAGTDPDNPDSDGDGILDGADNNDGDELSNAQEVLLRTNPGLADSDGNGIDDHEEDSDFDGINDWQEFVLRLNPGLVDSDGDGFDDAGEIIEGMDPRDGSDLPTGFIASSPSSYLNSYSEVPPSSLVMSLRSGTASYLNAQESVLPSSLPRSVSSKSASFLNAPVESLNGQNARIISPLTSYENQ